MRMENGYDQSLISRTRGSRPADSAGAIGERRPEIRKSVSGAANLPALQSNLTAIQAPPLSPSDQSMGLPALRSSLLSQLDTAERQARGSGKGQAHAATVLLQSSLRVVLLSLALALGIRAASPGPLP